MLELSGIPPEKRSIRITREEGGIFFSDCVSSDLTGLPGFQGSPSVPGSSEDRRDQPGSMESKRIQGLYFIGEVLDLDALTGGFNLQIAWSTAFAAASSINESI